KVTPRARRTSGGTGTTTMMPRPRLTRSGSRCPTQEKPPSARTTQGPKGDRAAQYSKMIGHEAACAAERSPPWLQTGVPPMPRVDHMRPDFQRDGHIRRAGGPGETYRVIEQSLLGPHLDQHRRHA